ncbi:MAG TPA: cytochrome c oxidase subunit 3 [Phycisphaerales bacterium]|nr:cytochrome c oxidase subunit 3 [Phycisphaerales bacterium]HRQ76607.1 cytochrome c oxidase subunit 3 [Phycisphaerales bacterium]
MKGQLFKDARSRDRALRMGMALFLASLGMLFAAGLVGYVVVRLQVGWPDDLPGLPPILWLSTIVLAASSASMQSSVNAARRGATGRLKSMMTITLFLAVLFLLMQWAAWSAWYAEVEPHWAESDSYRWALTSFFVMTGIHAAHVLGGLVPIFLVTGRAFAGAYATSRFIGVQMCAMYWHFLGTVWLVLFVSLLLGSRS